MHNMQTHMVVLTYLTVIGTIRKLELKLTCYKQSGNTTLDGFRGIKQTKAMVDKTVSPVHS
jgi:hypothetical protein